ncbi:MAG: hypothetical protein ACREXR_11450 [Gammaproteobacteria bacterium]
MPTVLVLMIVVFVVMIGGLAFFMYMDTKTQVVEPKYYGFIEGDSEASSPDAQAAHHADKHTGEIKAEVSLNGSGKAHALARLGHEFECKEKKSTQTIIKVKLDYRSRTQLEQGKGTLKAFLTVVPEPGSPRMLDLSQEKAGVTSKPEEGYIPIDRKFVVRLEPGQKIIVYAEVSATAESAPDKPATGAAEVQARVREISYRPKAKIFY